MFVPLLKVMEKTGLVSSISKEFNSAMATLKQVAQENAPDKDSKDNVTKTLALSINGTMPAVYGYGFYRSVANVSSSSLTKTASYPPNGNFSLN
jgi:hypothetical protein